MEAVTRTRFEGLVAELIEPLRRFLARRTDPATAEDVLAETLLVCWRRLSEIPAEPLPWAYGVARNCLANAERSRRRQDRLVARLVTLDPPGPPAGDASVDLTTALARLRPQDAELLRLWAWEELAAAEIGQVLGISANAATIRLHRARERLRAELERSGTGNERRKR
ncbi:sigma-70 family RNA polymerase sigma factor [Kineosporia sp. J2-2]|uniref:Sigma-70 family RNA polymerase sigma factor n=1 Tax=Kineosporia corallincola TaxID=2835133 RepID=A0ABS5TDE1_9ACTN|nr:sigma-70 family RNA polymerase sigma factor [Kineosporia corallincola]MBT0769056.1 sigma-70 family RNA polymerase sigma factor [Kineosporia corallincola]